MEIKLSQEQSKLLLEIVNRRDPGNRLIRSAQLDLEKDQRLALCELLADDLAETGLTHVGEVNRRGESIERLIDALRPRES